MAESERGTILYGMMGAGKSTLGEGLAQHMGQPFVDTDQLIEERFDMTCAELVAHPDRDFGTHQSLAILRYRPTSPEVIATGGSVAMYSPLVTHLGHYGVSIFIDVEPDVLESRLPAERIAALNNPKGLSFADLYQERATYYRRAADLVLAVAPDEAPVISLANMIDLRYSADQ